MICKCRTAAGRLALAAFILILAAAPGTATNLTGTFKHPDGSSVNGKLILLLSQPARLNDSSAQVVPMVKIFAVTNGALEAGAFVFGNDVLVPAGTYYLARLVDANNNLLFEQKWSITGVNLDLGTLTPTTTGVVLVDPLIKNVTTTQSVQGPVTFNSGVTAFSLTLNGNLNPGTGYAYDLGNPSTPWREIHSQRWNEFFRPGTSGGIVTAPSQTPQSSVLSSGGSIAAGTYNCVITYGNLNGETPQSTQVTVVVAAPSSRVLVKPNDFQWTTGAYKYQVYCGTVSSGPYFKQTPLTRSVSLGNCQRTSNVVTCDTSTTRHGFIDDDVVTIAGNDASIAGSQTLTAVSEPTVGNSTFTFNSTGANFGPTAGGTISFFSGIETDWQFVIMDGTEGFWMSAIASSGPNPPSINTATIDPLQVALNQTRSVVGTTIEWNKGIVLLGSGTVYTLTTPLIHGYGEIVGAGRDYKEQAGDTFSRIRSGAAWNAPHLGVVMVMSRYARLKKLDIQAQAGATVNSLFIGHGNGDHTGLTVAGVAIVQDNVAATTINPVRIERSTLNFGWDWSGSNTLSGAGKASIYARRSSVSNWQYRNGRINCGPHVAATAFKARGGTFNMSLGNVVAGLQPTVGFAMDNSVTESCKGRVWDMDGGYLRLLNGSYDADSSIAVGTDAVFAYGITFWTNGNSANHGLEISGTSSRINGAANAAATVKFVGPVTGGGVVVETRGVITGSTSSGTGVAIDAGGFSVPITYIGDGRTGHPAFDPNNPAGDSAANIINYLASGTGSNLLTGINIGERNTVSGQRINNYLSGGVYFGQPGARGQGLNAFWPAAQQWDWYFNDGGVTTNRIARWEFSGGAHFTLYKADGTSRLLRAYDNSTTSAVELGPTPAVGTDSLNLTNNWAIRFRNGANSADIRALRISSDNILLGEGIGNAILPATTATPLGNSTNRWAGSFTAGDFSGVVTSGVATGTAPFTITSATEVANLNAQRWHGAQAIDFTATLDFGSVAAHSCAELTITATGAAANNPVAPAWPASLEAGLTGAIRVSSANTITVRLCNVTVLAVDPASQTFGGRVIQ